MLFYLFKSMSILVILIAFYKLFLEKEKMHRFNRFYLISGLGLAFLTPIITIRTSATPTSSLPSSVVNTIHHSNYILLEESIESTDWIYLLELGIYLVCGILFLRFLINLILLIRKIITQPKTTYQGIKIVLVDDEVLPHTFLRYIFINKADFLNDNIEDELFTHEITHAKQLHSLDIILVELATIFQWFNPFAHIYKKAIQLNHEFLADQEVVKVHKNVFRYQKLLLEKSSEFSGHNLSSKLTFSVTKKRLTMMTKHFSRFRSVIYSLIMIPILISLVSCFGDYEYIKSLGIVNITEDYLSVDFNGMTQNQLSEAQTKLMDYNINLEFTSVLFDQNEKLTELAFDVSFPNGNSGSARISCNASNQPFGLWYDLGNGNLGTGFVDDIEMYRKKTDALKRAQQVKALNGQFYIDGYETDFNLATKWIHSAKENFHSMYSCDTLADSQFLFLRSK